MARNDEPMCHHLYLFLTEKHLSLCHCSGNFSQMFFPEFVFVGENFRQPYCTDFPLIELSDDGHHRRFSNPCCSAKFTCRDATVHQNLAFGLRFRYRGWSAAAGPVTSAFSLLVKRLTELTSMESSLYTLVGRL